MSGHDRKNAAGAGGLCQLRLRDAGEGREVSGAVWVRGEAGAAGGYVRLVGACGSRHMSTKGEFVEILEFTHFSRVFKFNKTSEIGRKKEIFNEIKVSVVMELV